MKDEPPDIDAVLSLIYGAVTLRPLRRQTKQKLVNQSHSELLVRLEAFGVLLMFSGGFLFLALAVPQNLIEVIISESLSVPLVVLVGLLTVGVGIEQANEGKIDTPSFLKLSPKMFALIRGIIGALFLLTGYFIFSWGTRSGSIIEFISFVSGGAFFVGIVVSGLSTVIISVLTIKEE